MGIIKKYREGDRFIAKLDKIEKTGNEEMYWLRIGCNRFQFSKEDLMEMECIPAYESFEGLEIIADAEQKYKDGYRDGYEAAKIHVTDALGIEDASVGYERAKRKIMDALEEE